VRSRSRERQRQGTVPYGVFFRSFLFLFSSSFVFGGCRDDTEPPNDSPNDDLRFVFSFFSEDVFVGSTRRSTGPPPFLPSDAAALVR
jgi:hypothetical protein